MNKKDKQPLYKELYNKELDRLITEIKAITYDIYSPENRLILKRIVYYGVMGTERDRNSHNLEDAMKRFERLEGLVQFIGRLTPIELMEIFPIEKTYNGEKWKTKDYFSTIEVIHKLDSTQPIHKSIDTFQLIWDYQNWDLSFFLLELMHCMSEVRKFQGHPSIMEEFLADQGIDTYTLHTDPKGKQYLYNRTTGKTTAVKTRKKRPFKVMKGGRKGA